MANGGNEGLERVPSDFESELVDLDRKAAGEVSRGLYEEASQLW